MAKPKTILISIPIILLATGILYYFIPSELAPAEDSGAIMAPIMAPTSANINYIKKYTQMVEPIFNSVPEKENFAIINGHPTVNMGFSLLLLKPWSERKRSIDQITAELMPKLWSIPGIMIFPINPPNIPGAGHGSPIQIELQILGHYKK